MATVASDAEALVPQFRLDHVLNQGMLLLKQVPGLKPVYVMLVLTTLHRLHRPSRPADRSLRQHPLEAGHPDPRASAVPVLGGLLVPAAVFTPSPQEPRCKRHLLLVHGP
jgi:hypothetical protein